MKLYYSPFACSLAAHIACLEAGLDFTLHRTELISKKIEGQGDLREINPMGQVPTLVTDDDYVLTENSAVLMYIADRAVSSQLAPSQSTMARYEVLRWISFVGTELHKNCLAHIFGAESSDALKAHARLVVHKPLEVVARHLETRESLLGGGFSVADAYLWWALTLLQHAKVLQDQYPSLRAFHDRHLKRPAVVAALRFEREQHARAQ
jgi:glutathione S-transferase